LIRSPRSIIDLLTERTLDPDLAAHLWLLLDGHVPLVVAGADRTARSAVLASLLDLDLDADRQPPLDDLSGAVPDGGPLRDALRGAGRGVRFTATADAGSLEDVFGLLRRRPFRLTDDDLTGLGAVLILDAQDRVAAAHYVRPVARDQHGHVQRLAPAVLATFDAGSGAFEHFGWGIVPELAFRVGRRAGDYDAEHARRSAFLAGLVEAGLSGRDAVRRAIAAFAITPASVTT
jgi:hypothetical protein